MRLTFKKEERLSRKKLIDELFKKGSSFSLPPLRVLFLETESEEVSPAQVLIGVSSKTIKRAVDRNRIKRLIREAYRHNKQLLYDTLDERHKKMLLALLYQSKEIIDYSSIQEKVKASLHKIIHSI